MKKNQPVRRNKADSAMPATIQKTHGGITTLDAVEEKIITLRNQLVLLDSDVAALYEVQTKEINQAVKNNPKKFPSGYIFELDDGEASNLRSKFLTLEKQEPVKSFDRFDNEEVVNLRSKILTANLAMSRVSPKAFTEKGLYMLATILKGDKAINATIEIIEAFAKMRAMTRSIAELMKDHTNEQKQKDMVRRGEELFGGIIGNALDTVGTETSFELNLAAFKIKHTVKRTKTTT
jgi:phage regulator Rha-like protein